LQDTKTLSNSPKETLVERLRTRAHIRRTIVSREHNRENDRIAVLLDEAADEIERLLKNEALGYSENFKYGDNRGEYD
jgi:hypothetical protein